MIFAFPDPEKVADKKPIAFDKEQPFRNLGIRVVNESAASALTVRDVELTLREYSAINGVQQMLKEPGAADESGSTAEGGPRQDSRRDAGATRILKGVVMKRRNMVRVVWVVLLMVGVAGMAGLAAHAGTNPRVIEITAKRFGFTPDQVTLKKGETVTLRLRSEDVTHGFFMRKLKIDTEIEPGHPTEVTITPDTAGSFTTICDHSCGANHGNIKMTIVVE